MYKITYPVLYPSISLFVSLPFSLSLFDCQSLSPPTLSTPFSFSLCPPRSSLSLSLSLSVSLSFPPYLLPSRSVSLSDNIYSFRFFVIHMPFIALIPLSLLFFPSAMISQHVFKILLPHFFHFLSFSLHHETQHNNIKTKNCQFHLKMSKSVNVFKMLD